MRDGWRDVTVSHVADVASGGTPSTKNEEYWNGDVVWVTPTDLTALRWPVVAESPRRITEKGLANSAAKLIPAGAVLVTSRATIGVAAITGRELTVNQGVTALIPKQGVLAEWLYYWVCANRAEFESRAAGTTFREISRKKTAAIPLSLPPEREQERIADLLRSVDRGIFATQQLRDRASEHRAAMLADLLTSQDGWAVARLADIVDFASGVAFPHVHQGHAEGEFPFFKVSDMNAPENARGMVVAANWINETQRKALKAPLHPSGTVIFPKVGAALKTEKRRLLTRVSAFDNNVMGLIPHDDVLSEYLFAFMETVRLGDYCQDGVVPSVNQSIVGSLTVPLPPPDEQARIAQTVGAADATIAAVTHQVVELQRLRAALLAELLSGARAIPTAYDRFLSKDAPEGELAMV